jgi:hypothetical protein
LSDADDRSIQQRLAWWQRVATAAQDNRDKRNCRYRRSANKPPTSPSSRHADFLPWKVGAFKPEAPSGISVGLQSSGLGGK